MQRWKYYYKLDSKTFAFVKRVCKRIFVLCPELPWLELRNSREET